jgi:hypothetical protein
MVLGVSWLKRSDYLYGTILFLYQSPNFLEEIEGLGALAIEYTINKRLHFRIGTTPEILGRTLSWVATRERVVQVEKSSLNYSFTGGAGLNLGKLVADVAFRAHPDFPLSTRFTLGWLFN